MKLRWQFGIIAGIFLVIFTLYPQFKMIYLRGDAWEGHYSYNDIDEVAYASYVKALIDGRPRKNDPYTGRDDSPESPQEESLFSIQFAAPYTLAIPARIFGINAPWAMTIGGALAGFFAALACFWLVGKLTDDSLFAMTGTLVILAGGAIMAGEGAIGEITGWSYAYPYFPAFRRYIPAVPFAAFFAMMAFVWLLITSENERKRIIFCILASFCFAFTVFSYFYTWTTAAAWLGSIFLIWLIVRPEGFWKDFKAFLALGFGCLLALIPYAILLSKRSHTMDEVQLLVNTRAFDFARVPIYISFVALAIVASGILLKKISIRERETLFAISFALVPLIVFNQQVITGRSLQPIHYQVFIGNYVAGLALIVSIGIILKKIDWFKSFTPKIVLPVFALIAIVWGFVECHYTVKILDDANIERDKAMPVARRLTELAKNEPNPYKTVVMPFSMLQGDDLPTVAPQAVLWARHQHVFAGVTWQENKERYYQYLYFQNIDENQLANSIKQGDFVSMIALFGWGRHTDRLNSAFKPLTYGEIDEEARKMGEYLKNFNPRSSPDTILSYAVVPTDWEVNLTNLDKWYERDNGEIHGDYLLYKLKLKN
jgi:hypothetical protein